MAEDLHDDLECMRQIVEDAEARLKAFRRIEHKRETIRQLREGQWTGTELPTARRLADRKEARLREQG
jgi:hypothetical protein